MHHVSPTTPPEHNITNAMAEQYMNKIMRDSEYNDAALIGTREDELPGSVSYTHLTLPTILLV